MKIYAEKRLQDFNFWNGGELNAQKLTWEEMDDVETVLEDMYPEGMDETEINDLFWFDFGSVCDMIGLYYDVETDEIIRD